jgi:hypothetical protein
MTSVGKLLVVLNLVMSCFFMAFAVVVYTAREDLQGKILAKDKQIAQLNNTSSQQQAEAEKQTKLVQDRDAELEKIKAESAKKIAELNTQVAGLDSELQKARSQATDATAAVKVTTTEQVQRQKEVEALRAIRDEFLTKNSDLVAKNTDLQDQNAQFKNDLELLTARNEELDTRLRQLSEYVVRRQGSMPEEAELVSGGEVPPPPNVDGVVRKVDPTGQYIEISLGEDDGIRKGQILETWRTKPYGKYLGRIRIVQTQATTSVAKPISVTGLIQENVEVGPKIIVNGN